jgi:hypothetical protein
MRMADKLQRAGKSKISPLMMRSLFIALREEILFFRDPVVKE